MNLSPQKFNEMLDNMPMDEEVKEQVKAFLNPMFDFSEYLKNKLDATDEEVETLFTMYFNSKQEDLKEAVEAGGYFKAKETLAEKIGEYSKEFAEFHDYEKAEEFGQSMGMLMSIQG